MDWIILNWAIFFIFFPILAWIILFLFFLHLVCLCFFWFDVFRRFYIDSLIQYYMSHSINKIICNSCDKTFWARAARLGSYVAIVILKINFYNSSEVTDSDFLSEPVNGVGLWTPHHFFPSPFILSKTKIKEMLCALSLSLNFPAEVWKIMYIQDI